MLRLPTVIEHDMVDAHAIAFYEHYGGGARTTSEVCLWDNNAGMVHEKRNRVDYCVVDVDHGEGYNSFFRRNCFDK